MKKVDKENLAEEVEKLKKRVAELEAKPKVEYHYHYSGCGCNQWHWYIPYQPYWYITNGSGNTYTATGTTGLTSTTTYASSGQWQGYRL